MKKNSIILLTILIMLVLYIGAVIFITKPEGFDLSSLFTNNATLSQESKDQIKSEIKDELSSELSEKLSSELSEKLSSELDSKLEKLIDEKLEQKISALTEEQQALITKEDYDAIREQVRTEKIDEVLSKLED